MLFCHVIKTYLVLKYHTFYLNVELLVHLTVFGIKFDFVNKKGGTFFDSVLPLEI